MILQTKMNEPICVFSIAISLPPLLFHGCFTVVLPVFAKSKHLQTLQRIDPTPY